MGEIWATVDLENILMLKNASTLAIRGAHTAENELLKVQNRFHEILFTERQESQDLSQIIEVLRRNFVAFASASPVTDVLEANTKVLYVGRCHAVIPDVECVNGLKALSDFTRFAGDVVCRIVVTLSRSHFAQVWF